MDNKKDKELDFIRGREKLKAAPVKSADYSSPLEKDVMKVKSISNSSTPDPKTVIKNTTQHINTKTSAPLIKGQDFIEKIAALRAGKIKPTLGGVAAAVGTTLGSAMLPESAMASTPVQTGLRALDEGDPSSFLLPGNAGPVEGSLDDRIEKGTLTDEDKAQLRLQALKQIR